MKQIEFRRWEVRSSASSGALLIGELFFPLNKGRNELESDSNESDNGSLKREKKKKAVRSSRERIASPSGINQPLLPRFRYSSEWIESGFALGADLPLENGIKLPSRGKKLFGFLADRALSPQSGSIFQSARAAGSKVMDGSEAFRNAGDMEMLSLLLPHRDAHAGGAEFYTDGVQAGSASRIPNESSSLESILYALHAEERGRANLKALIDLSSATALPGRHTAQVVVSGNDEKALTLRRYSDLIDAPLWREVFMRLARDCGIECVETRLADTMGARALFADRAQPAHRQAEQAQIIIYPRTPHAAPQCRAVRSVQLPFRRSLPAQVKPPRTVLARMRPVLHRNTYFHTRGRHPSQHIYL